MVTTKDINLTPLLKYHGSIDPIIIVEYKIIEYYSTIQTLEYNTLDKVIQFVLNQKYYTDNVIYNNPYTSLSTFYQTHKFIHSYKYYYDLLTILINRNVEPYYNNITFNHYASNTSNELIVNFNIEYL